MKKFLLLSVFIVSSAFSLPPTIIEGGCTTLSWGIYAGVKIVLGYLAKK